MFSPFSIKMLKTKFGNGENAVAHIIIITIFLFFLLNANAKEPHSNSPSYFLSPMALATHHLLLLYVIAPPTRHVLRCVTVEEHSSLCYCTKQEPHYPPTTSSAVSLTVAFSTHLAMTCISRCKDHAACIAEQ